MCVQLDGTDDLDAVAAHFQARRTMTETSVAGRIRPTDRAPTLMGAGSDRLLGWTRWGWQQPEYGKPDRTKLERHARIETAATKKLWSEAFARRRCVVVARGWWEVQEKTAGQKRGTPYYFTGPSTSGLAIAALWRREGDEGRFSLVTTEALPEHHSINDRMPVILDEESLSRWLDPTADLGQFVHLGAKPEVAITAYTSCEIKCVQPRRCGQNRKSFVRND